MKVLIITYYWPPAGGPGVQRWLKFVKYLQDFNIEPVVFTAKNPNYPIVDVSLENEIPKNITILKEPIWEPNNFLSIFKRETKQSAGFLSPNPSFLGKLMQYVRANFFIPDTRKFWVKPSVKYLEKYISENEIDVIITSGPPHSMHLIGLELKRKTNLNWISDFRDPWTDIDYFHQLPLTKKALLKHQTLEQNVLKESDAVLVVGETMKNNYNAFNKNIHVITNGFDYKVQKSDITLDKRFSITHIGMMNADRNPVLLWKVLSDICKENTEFKNDLEIKLVGKISNEVKSSLSNSPLINTLFIDYLKHKDVLEYQNKSQILLLCINNVPSAKGIITGKIFEYLNSQRPILCIGPENGDAAEIINNTNSGFVINFEEEIKLKSVILNMYNKYKSLNLNIKSTNINQYHRKELTKKLSEVIREVAKQ